MIRFVHINVGGTGGVVMHSGNIGGLIVYGQGIFSFSSFLHVCMLMCVWLDIVPYQCVVQKRKIRSD